MKLIEQDLEKMSWYVRLQSSDKLSIKSCCVYQIHEKVKIPLEDQVWFKIAILLKRIYL